MHRPNRLLESCMPLYPTVLRQVHRDHHARGKVHEFGDR